MRHVKVRWPGAQSRWLLTLLAVLLGDRPVHAPPMGGRPANVLSESPRAWTVDFTENPTEQRIVTAAFIGEHTPRMAVMVGDLDEAAAVWRDWMPRFEVDLGPGDGEREVWVGLQLASGGANWRRFLVTVDTAPPRVTLVDLPARTSQSMIQVLGCASEPIGTVQYDLENSAGIERDQDGFGVERERSAPPGFGRADWFQLFDVELAPGTNTFTVRVKDRAGHPAEVRGAVVFDVAGDEEAPRFVVHWPEQDSQIGSDQCTVRGQIDDPSASLFASDDTGQPIEGIVERDGRFWVEDVPLRPGTNLLTLLATDAAGNRSQAALTVVRLTGFWLRMDPVPPEELTKARTTVTGSISTNDHTVWVNGQKAVLGAQRPDGGWHWVAMHVPLPEGGTAVIQMRAIPNSDNGGNGTPAGRGPPNQARSALPACRVDPGALLGRLATPPASPPDPADVAEVRAWLRRWFLAEPEDFEPVLDALSRTATPAARAVLLELALHGSTSPERRGAARKLLNSQDPRLRDWLLEATDPGVRAVLFRARARDRGPITREDQARFQEALLGGDLELRLAALGAIAAAARADEPESLVAWMYAASSSVPGHAGERKRLGHGGTTEPLGSPAGQWGYHLAFALRNLRHLHPTAVVEPTPTNSLAVDCFWIAEAWRGETAAKEALTRILAEAPEPDLRLAAVEGWLRIGDAADWERVRRVAANDPLVIGDTPQPPRTDRAGFGPSVSPTPGAAPTGPRRPVLEAVERWDRERDRQPPGTR